MGLGSIGPRHLAVIDCARDAEIVAICDIDPVKCKKYSELYNGIPSFTDFQTMLDNTKADIVDICTPHYLHSPMSIRALSLGRHVLVEKPMSLTVSDAISMIVEANKNGRRLMVVKQNRYNIPVKITRDALTSGWLGKIFMVQCNVLWNRYGNYYTESPWRGKKETEGGALYTQVSHFIDLMIWWFGDVLDARSVTACMDHQIETEDCGTAELIFSSGVMGSLSWSTCVYQKNYEGSITIIGKNGIIKIGGQYLNKIEYWDVKDHPLPKDIQFIDTPNSYGKYQGSSSNHDKVIRDVVGDLRSGSYTAVEGAEGIKTVSAIEKIYKNAKILPA